EPPALHRHLRGARAYHAHPHRAARRAAPRQRPRTAHAGGPRRRGPPQRRPPEGRHRDAPSLPPTRTRPSGKVRERGKGEGIRGTSAFIPSPFPLPPSPFPLPPFSFPPCLKT